MLSDALIKALTWASVQYCGYVSLLVRQAVGPFADSGRFRVLVGRSDCGFLREVPLRTPAILSVNGFGGDATKALRAAGNSTDDNL